MPPLTHASPIALKDCHLAKTIEVIGDRWTLLILRSAMFGVRRFDDFQTELNIPRTVLSGRLKRLCVAELIEKKTYKQPGKRTRPEYILTQKGQTLQPALIALTQWGDEWLAPQAIPPISFTHAGTRKTVRAGFVDTDGRVVDPDDMRISLRR
ncbi:MAG: helix-turn-helix domain-containing protein [Henriciella sp.]